MNEFVLVAVGVSLGIALSLLWRKPAPNVTINNSVSLDPYDDDTDPLDDDDEDERAPWRRSLN